MKYLESTGEIGEFVDSVDTFLLDCDGVLWHGNKLLPGISETIEWLRSIKKLILFVTNNSTKSREGYVKKFHQLGLEWVGIDHVISSSFAAAYYLSSHIQDKSKKIYVIGQKGITEELEKHGLQWCGSQMDDGDLEIDELGKIVPDHSIGSVLIGFDLTFNYRKLSKAMSYIKYSNATFYATNDDSSYPAHGRLYPGTGTIVKSVEYCTDTKPIVLGKPHAPMMDAICDKYRLDRLRTCMVGDRLNTDIMFGKNGGLQTLLVLTGVTQKKDLDTVVVTTDTEPDFYIDSFSGLLPK